MKKQSGLGKRMKRYEAVNQTLLPLNSYVIVRCDARAFHTYTKKLKHPFDEQLIEDMDATCKALCMDMQNAVLGYVQSDEISILMYDGVNPESEPWFGNEVEKIVSISASIATAAFNQLRTQSAVQKAFFTNHNFFTEKWEAIYDATNIVQAQFDSRVFVLPNVDEVVNYFLWRMRDCVINSISSVGQANFKYKELFKKSTNEVQEMLFSQKGINWNEFPIRQKRGGLCVKTEQGWQMVDVPHIVCEPNNEFYKMIP